MANMTLRIDDDLYQRLDALAEATDRSKAYLATQAVKQFLETNEWQVQAIRTALAEADAAAPDDFVDNDQVMAWLDSWGTDAEKSSPL